VLQSIESRLQNSTPGVEHHPPALRENGEIQADSLPHSPPYSIPDHGLSNSARNGKPHLRTFRLFCDTQTKGREELAGVAEPLVINFAEVTTAKNPVSFRKAEPVASDEDWLAQLGGANSALITDGKFVAATGTAAGEHSPTVLCFHALTEPVSLRPLTIIRLKRTFWHLGESRAPPDKPGVLFRGRLKTLIIKPGELHSKKRSDSVPAAT